MKKEDEIRSRAQDFARRLMSRMFSKHKDRITSEWLMSKHPSLTPEQAEEYRIFCQNKTIILKGCYGDGSIMWPKWICSKRLN